MRIENYLILEDGVMTGTTTIVSDPIWLGHIANWAVQIIWTKGSGTLDGDYKIQVSNGPSKQVSNQVAPVDGATWSDFTTPASVTDGNGSAVLNFENAGYLFARVSYTNTTGVGSMNVLANGKGF